DETMILADMARKALNQVKGTVAAIPRRKSWDEEKVERVADLLTGGTWTHDYPNDLEEARASGLAVEADAPEEAYDLIARCPQPRSQGPGVQYVPAPYRQVRQRWRAAFAAVAPGAARETHGVR